MRALTVTTLKKHCRRSC